MFKKIIMTITFLTFVFLLAACGDGKVKVSFDVDGGSAVEAVSLDQAGKIALVKDPVKEGQSFAGWFYDKKFEKPFSFEDVIEKSVTLYAKFTSNVVLKFEPKNGKEGTYLDLGANGKSAAKPADPTREGYRFGGWFNGKAGLTYLEPHAVQFPTEVSKSKVLYAYWEPLNSKEVSYSKDESYTTTLTSGSSLVLNPLVYQWDHENEFIDLLRTPMYSTEVDWALAIEQGVADYVGDFSKIEAKEYSIEAFDYVYILVGATRYPLDSNGDEHLTPEGGYDRDGANQFMDTVWTVHIREDLKFEDGTPITAETFEYSLKQYLDPVQANYRSTIFYRDADNDNGYKLLNGAEYLKQSEEEPVAWEEVGFKVLDDYSFEVTFYEPVSQATAVGFSNSLRLVHPEKYAASLDENGANSKYGTPSQPYVSYGSYILKSWDENQKMVFNKNYDYVLKQTINYKSYVYEIVDDLEKAYELFKDGTTNVLGLTNDYYAEFAEDPNVYDSWNGFPQYLIINTAASRLAEGGYEHPTIMYDVNFRRALFFGFNRTYFARSVYAPNHPSLLPVPYETKAYIQDPLFYSESPNHLEVLQEYGIDPETNGYIPEKAKELFNEAYDAWVAAGNTGPVTLRYPASNDTTLSESLANYVKDSYETLFGSDKLVINIVWGNQTTVSDAQKNWEFDIALSAIGFGLAYDVKFQYAAIAFLGSMVGAANLGLTQPYEYNPETGENEYGAYLDFEVEIDLTPTYEYLLAKKDENPNSFPADYQMFLDYLEADEDKPAGIFKGVIDNLIDIALAGDSPYDGIASAPFAGATQEQWKITAALERAFYDNPTLIPTVSRKSATVYKPNVTILWPDYSSAFGWGAARYRFLNSDPDFADGLYNSYAE